MWLDPDRKGSRVRKLHKQANLLFEGEICTPPPTHTHPQDGTKNCLAFNYPSTQVSNNRFWRGRGEGPQMILFSLKIQIIFLNTFLVYFELLFSVLFWTILSKSFRVSKAGNVSSVEGHCTGHRLEYTWRRYRLTCALYRGRKLHCRYRLFQYFLTSSGTSA